MHRKLCEKQPALVNKNGPILLHDNASPHVRVAQTKLNNLGIEVLPHPPYFPDFSPTEFHFFKHLHNFTTNRQFQNYVAGEEAFKDFIESRDLGLYRNGINHLITRWQKCIQSQGCYFD